MIGINTWDLARLDKGAREWRLRIKRFKTLEGPTLVHPFRLAAMLGLALFMSVSFTVIAQEVDPSKPAPNATEAETAEATEITRLDILKLQAQQEPEELSFAQNFELVFGPEGLNEEIGDRFRYTRVDTLVEQIPQILFDSSQRGWGLTGYVLDYVPALYATKTLQILQTKGLGGNNWSHASEFLGAIYPHLPYSAKRSIYSSLRREMMSLPAEDESPSDARNDNHRKEYNGRALIYMTRDRDFGDEAASAVVTAIQENRPENKGYDLMRNLLIYRGNEADEIAAGRLSQRHGLFSDEIAQEILSLFDPQYDELPKVTYVRGVIASEAHNAFPVFATADRRNFTYFPESETFYLGMPGQRYSAVGVIMGDHSQTLEPKHRHNLTKAVFQFAGFRHRDLAHVSLGFATHEDPEVRKVGVMMLAYEGPEGYARAKSVTHLMGAEEQILGSVLDEDPGVRRAAYLGLALATTSTWHIPSDVSQTECLDCETKRAAMRVVLSRLKDQRYGDEERGRLLIAMRYLWKKRLLPNEKLQENELAENLSNFDQREVWNDMIEVGLGSFYFIPDHMVEAHDFASNERVYFLTDAVIGTFGIFLPFALLAALDVSEPEVPEHVIEDLMLLDRYFLTNENSLEEFFTFLKERPEILEIAP